MNHLSKISLLGAVALLAAVGCQREPVVDNPNFNSETNEVLTQLSLNVSTNTDTKQMPEIVQIPTGEATYPAFRGLDNALLLSYVQSSDGLILATDANAAKLFDLSELLSSNTGTSNEQRRVLEMSLPLSTNTLLFYGKAKQGGLPSGYTLTGKDYYGSMNLFTVTDQAGSANFELCQRLTDKTTYTTVCKMIAGILTIVMNTNLAGTAHHVAIDGAKYPAADVTYPYKYSVATTEYPETLTWADYAAARYGTSTTAATLKSPVEPTHNLYPLEEKLAYLYNEMTNINDSSTTDGEIRAGSIYAVGRTLQDLWTVINEIRCADPLSKAETVAKYLANRISLQLNAFFNPTGGVPGNGSAIGALHLKDLYDDDTSVPTLVTAFANAVNEWPTSTDATTQGVINAAKPTSAEMTTDAMKLIAVPATIAQFPLCFGLPRGASHYKFDKTSKLFSYVGAFNTSGMGGIDSGTGSYGIHSYYYPPELMYFGNSPIRASQTEHKAGDYSTSSIPDWETSTWTTDWDKAHVEASTRSVAMQYNINYGTALLSTQVGYKVATLKDNNHAIQQQKAGTTLPSTTEPDRAIDVSTSSPFELTGIIVGGQYANVGWDFLPIADPATVTTAAPAGNKIIGFIYDRDIPSSTSYDASSIPVYASTTAYSKPVYTMVLDNYNSGGTQDKVYVALEFKNNSGIDFYGNANLIRKDGYFYLIGELDPGKTGLAAITWPTTYKIPPYTTAGASQEVTRVFIQDYLTSVKFTFGENSLKHAYLTVPDLRSSSLTLGLSVDVTWRTGLNFEDVLLGGE